MIRRYTTGDYAALAVLALIGLVPVVMLAARPLLHGGVYTGAIGTDPIDEFQYLAWVRDEGFHGLSSNLFGMTGGSHVYLQPMWFLSGILWRLGLGLQLSYVLWVPVAVVALWIGVTAYARRFAPTAWRRLAIVLLALFFSSPLGWLNLPVTHWVAEAQLPMGDDTMALQLWLALHTAIAIGIMPLVLLGCEWLLGQSQTARGRRYAIIGGAALVGWLHSWQGEELVIVVAALALLRAPRWQRIRSLLPVLTAACLPLIYQLVLAKTDPGWKVIEQSNNRPDLIVLTPQLAVIGPLLAVALIGLIRRRPRSDADWTLVLWPLAAALVFRFNPEFPPHALQGVTLPLAVLAVLGWPQTRLAQLVGWAAIAASTTAGMAYFAKSFAPEVRANRVLYFQTSSEHAALSELARASAPGAVLAPYPLSLEVPAYTDRPVWDGHQAWTPDYATRATEANDLFAGLMSADQARGFVRTTGVRWLLIDCSPRTSEVLHQLAPMVLRSRSAGCARIVEVQASR